MDAPRSIDFAELAAETRWVGGLARTLASDPSTADDIVQDSWLEVLRRPDSVGGHFKRQWAAIVRNVSLRRRRSDARRSARELAAARPEPTEGTLELVERTVLERALIDAVLRLPDDQRDAVLLRFFENQKPQAIARRFGVPVETIRTRLKRALGRLRAELDDQNDVGRGWRSTVLTFYGWPGTSVARRAAKRFGLFLGIGIVTKLGKILLAFVLLIVAAVGLLQIWKTGTDDSRLESERSVDSPQRAPDHARRADPSRSDEPPTTAATEIPASKPISTGAPEVARSAKIRGFVRGPDGLGIPDMIVVGAIDGPCTTMTEAPDLVNQSIHEIPRDLFGSGAIVTKTADDGSYLLDEVPRVERAAVIAYREDFGIALSPGIDLSIGAVERTIDLSVEPGLRLFGRITSRGLPAAKNASIFILAKTAGGWSSSGIATADADGRYKTVALPFRSMRVRASAEGHDTDERSIEDLPRDVREYELNFDLRAIDAIHGRIVDLSGASADLRSIAEKLGMFERLQLLLSWNDPTDANLQASRLPSGGKLDVESSTFVSYADTAQKPYLAVFAGRTCLDAVRVENGQKTATIAIDPKRMPEPKPFSKIVVIARSDATNEFVRSYDAKLSCAGSDPDSTINYAARAHEAADGKAVFDFVTAERGTLSITAPGFMPYSRPVVIEGKETTVEVTLAPIDAEIEGLIVDRAGRPIENAKVFVLLPTNIAINVGESDHRPYRLTSSEGRFRIDKLARGEIRLMIVPNDDHDAPAARSVTLHAGKNSIEVVIEKGTEVGVIAEKERSDDRYTILNSAGEVVRDDVIEGIHRAGTAGFSLSSGNYTAVLSRRDGASIRQSFTVPTTGVVKVPETSSSK